MTLVRPPPSSRDLIFSDGEPLESGRHVDQMLMLIESLRLAWADRRDFHCGGNEFLYFSETQSRRNDFRGPDFYVVLGVKPKARDERKGWVVWEEDGKAPDVIVEVLSESTAHVDRGDKMRIYGRTLKVGEYFLYDPATHELEGYTLAAGGSGYERKSADSRGYLECAQLGLWFGVVRSSPWGDDAPWLRLIDRDGRVLPAGAELAQRAAERANAEAERANAEAERANAEAERANAEAERAERLAAELQALRARLAGD